VITLSALQQLRAKYGSRLQENIPMAGFTSVHIGGPADALLIASSASEFEEFASFLWELHVPFLLLGGGSNVLVSDKGIRGMVLINRTSEIRIATQSEPPTAWAESGVSLAALARKAAESGFSGLEWASPIPGSVGGAVYGNAGAHGGEICRSLILAEILHPVEGKLSWNCDQMMFAYRSSRLKQSTKGAIILAAQFKLKKSTSEEVLAKMKEFSDRRRVYQPTGLSIGSTFRNPTGDKAGRLIEAAGLKGKRIGGAMFSPVHANFIINDQDACAADYLALINLAQSEVKAKFDITLQPEIELIGDWDEASRSLFSVNTGKTE
jgi:UDP-N-acetylmuramate dehydrogenase